MKVSVPFGLKDWVDQRIAEGRYASASDLVRDLLQRKVDDEAMLAKFRSSVGERVGVK